MKPRPGKYIAPGFRVAILRLMHMPQEHQMNAIHEPTLSNVKSELALHSAFRIMRILDRYIVREVFRHALLGLVVFTFVFFVPQLVRVMALFVRHSGSGGQILKLFICILPGIFTFTIPMAVLIGVLLGLGRMSADSEIIALTALGIGRRRILVPVAVLALAGTLATLVMTLWLGPVSLRTFRALVAD